MPDTPATPKREVLLRTDILAPDDQQLVTDLKAVAHLQRTTPAAVIADIVRSTLPPRFATQIAAA